MTLKENSIGLIPFSRDEVKVGDRILGEKGLFSNYDTYGIVEEKRGMNGNTGSIWVACKSRGYWLIPSIDKDTYWFYIDRRPRYKRILDSLLGITIKSEK